MNPTASQPGSLFSLRAAACGVVLLWAALYLPCLGTVEMKGEEGRRTLPAVAMIESGNWMVPSVGGESYARKPPLLNWSIALVIGATGVVNEWTARLPSALAVLPMALGMLLFLRRLLGLDTALLATVMYLVNATMLEKGRLAELESYTITTYGLAFLAWLHGEVHGSKLVRWILPGLFLSLGQMTKGPMPLLLFFYLPVGLHLWQTKRMRELLSPAHLVCVAITWLPFVIWSRLMMRQMGAETVSNVWSQELAMRVVPPDFSLGGYLEVILRGFLNFMPWVFFLPLLWRSAVLQRLPEAQRGLFLAVRRALVVGFIVVGCLPGARPRYTIQLLIPLFVLLAWAMAQSDLPKCWLGWRRLLQGLAVIAALGALGGAGYLRVGIGLWLLAAAIAGAAVVIARRLGQFSHPQELGWATGWVAALTLGVAWLALLGLGERLPSPERRAAREIAAWLPPGAHLIAVRPGYERILAHLGFGVRYAPGLKELPAERPLFLFAKQPDDLEQLRHTADAVKLPTTNHLKGREFELWRLDGKPPAP